MHEHFKLLPLSQAPSAAAPSDASRRSELTATIASLMTQLQQHSAHVASDIINVHQDLANGEWRVLRVRVGTGSKGLQ